MFACILCFPLKSTMNEATSQYYHLAMYVVFAQQWVFFCDVTHIWGYIAADYHIYLSANIPFHLNK